MDVSDADEGNGLLRRPHHHKSFLTKLKIWIRARVRGSEFFLIPIAVVVGLVAGALVTAMSDLAQLAHILIYGIPIDVKLSAADSVNPIVAALSLFCAGITLGTMEWYRRRSNISGATDPIEANALRGGRLSLRDSLVVSTQTLISNGSGASVGLEAGYTQIGSGVASLIGRKLNLRRNDLRLMVGSGAAAAIAAAFNAPITGAFYACELIVGTYSVSSAAPILAAAISGTLLSRTLGMQTYSLTLYDVAATDSRQFSLMIIIALLISLIGIIIMRAAPIVERAFSQPFVPIILRPALGGLIVAALTSITPQVLGAGHGAMILDLSRQMPAKMLAALILLKTTACLVSLGSGFRGGLFFASLFLGSMMGEFYAAIIPYLDIHIDPTISALTAMSCLGVAIVGGPLTMSFMVLEMTRNLDLTAGVLASCMVTSVVVRGLFGHSFSTWRLHLRGETIRSAADVGWIRNLTVRRLMRPDAVAVLPEQSISKSRNEHPLGSCRALFLVDEEAKVHGTVLMADLFSSDFDIDADSRPISAIAKYAGVVLTPEMNIKAAMLFFDKAEAEILPVMEGGKVVGFVTESFARRRYAEEIEQATAGVFE